MTMSELLKNIDARTKLAGTNKLEILLFFLGVDQRTGRRETYGINVFKVREVMRTPVITAAPDMPPSVEGMVSLRGALVPVIENEERIIKRTRKGQKKAQTTLGKKKKKKKNKKKGKSKKAKNKTEEKKSEVKKKWQQQETKKINLRQRNKKSGGQQGRTMLKSDQNVLILSIRSQDQNSQVEEELERQRENGKQSRQGRVK
eukprot:TRINITY_DN460_c0_g1_i19.p3 TRINITY_DN460_c0_g1~~TRINITY_DN460_c0_g1_i19.p3  ORF type:complete len:202 (+),score=29.25 TRINITY_DN460_c0_g1_i19:632-1237(+)